MANEERVTQIQIGGRTVTMYTPADASTMVTATYDSKYFRRDHFGRVIVDACPSDHAHLTAPGVPGKERQGCRETIDRLFEQFVGQRGTLTVNIHFEPAQPEVGGTDMARQDGTRPTDIK